ncbi:mycofactocin biosynthesis glycosyltransferase MftF [Dactylosporangium sp. NPDC000244]|uniref:mycofactocin biosynthesis glycosyltransferase MftF n=1 Tax=Dactylosporangium sp. NPDC000244 TaxID=3154365 RepID=UPI003331F636
MTPLPIGFGVGFDAGARLLDDATLSGGAPPRILRLAPAGRRALRELQCGPVSTAVGGALARKLTDAGLLHPRPPALRERPDATVVIPVRDRVPQLDRCLAGLGRDYPVIVVDDGSRDPRAVAAVAARHGATVVHRPHNGGAGAARNTGVRHVSTEIVVMVDSDCIPVPGWIERLAAHLADPLVAVAAPRIVPLPTAAPATAIGRYNRACGSLDLGEREARVVPLTRVAYVPTAALVVRRAALLHVARGGDVFDPAMPVGEDVDLIWRLHHAGWRVRYDPAVQVQHDEPKTWPALLSRRFRYGTSAPHLAQRHPAEMPPLIVSPLPAATVAALLARRPLAAGAAFTATVASAARTLHRAHVPGDPVRDAVPAMLGATYRTWLNLGRYSVQFASPLLLAAVLAPAVPHERRPWTRRLAAASLLLGPGLAGWCRHRPRLDPARFTAASIADDIAYGSGVWFGSVRHRTLSAIRPVIVGGRPSDRSTT